MIDWNRVQMLKDEVGAEDFDEIVELFLEEVETAVADLPTSVQNNTLAESMHFLKGSALSVGFSQFSELCQKGELAAERSGSRDVDLDEITTVFEASKQAFLAGLSNRSAA